MNPRRATPFVTLGLAVLVVAAPGIAAEPSFLPGPGFEPITLPATVTSPSTIRGVVAGEPGVVAIGSVGAPEVAAPLILFSPDGTTWEAPALPPSGVSAIIAGAVPWQGGFLAVGTDPVLADDDPTVIDAVNGAGDSADGRTWEQTETAPVLFDSTMIGVAVHGGMLYSVGCVADLPSSCLESSLWRSSDGRDWEAVTFPDSASVLPTAIAAGAPGLIITGIDTGSGEPRVIASTDGSDWQPASLMNYGGIWSASAGPQGWVAAGGQDGTTESSRAGFAIRSPDGFAWTEITGAILPERDFRAVLADPVTLLGGSRPLGEGRFVPSVWVLGADDVPQPFVLAGVPDDAWGEVLGLALTADGRTIAGGWVGPDTGNQAAALWSLPAREASRL